MKKAARLRTGRAPAADVSATPQKRASWDEYFMRIAIQAAARSTCDRKHVGAVVVRDKTILSTGYNGSIRGMPHCDDVGHMLENSHCIATVHAEANAIIQAARNGTAINGADILSRHHHAGIASSSSPTAASSVFSTSNFTATIGYSPAPRRRGLSW